MAYVTSTPRMAGLSPSKMGTPPAKIKPVTKQSQSVVTSAGSPTRHQQPHRPAKAGRHALALCRYRLPFRLARRPAPAGAPPRDRSPSWRAQGLSRRCHQPIANYTAWGKRAFGGVQAMVDAVAVGGETAKRPWLEVQPNMVAVLVFMALLASGVLFAAYSLQTDIVASGMPIKTWLPFL